MLAQREYHFPRTRDQQNNSRKVHSGIDPEETDLLSEHVSDRSEDGQDPAKQQSLPVGRPRRSMAKSMEKSVKGVKCRVEMQAGENECAMHTQKSPRTAEPTDFSRCVEIRVFAKMRV